MRKFGVEEYISYWAIYSLFFWTFFIRRLKSLYFLSKTRKRYPCPECRAVNFQISKKYEFKIIEKEGKKEEFPITFFHCDDCGCDYPAFWTQRLKRNLLYTLVPLHRYYDYLDDQRRYYHPIYLFPIDYVNLTSRIGNHYSATLFVAIAFTGIFAGIGIRDISVILLCLLFSIVPLVIIFVYMKNAIKK